MTDLTRLPPKLDKRSRSCRAVVECPKGSRGKYAYDPELGAFELKRILPDGMSFPLDFGFIPSTKAEDGDPLDVMILSDAPTPLGVVTPVRLVGVIEAEQTEDGETVRNDRILAAALTSQMFEAVRGKGDLAKGFLENLLEFWRQYDALRGVTFEVVAVSDAAKALRLVEQSLIAV